MLKIPSLIGKSKLMRGFQCQKSIYLSIHHKDLEPPITEELQALFDQGNEVGKRAREYFPNGILIDNKPWDFVGALKQTREQLSKHVECLFEAAFEYKGCFARVDILQYSKESQRWTITEVKSTTKVKDEHMDDIGLQAWILANAGLPIEKIIIQHLNPLCIFPNLTDLFISEDVTDRVREKYKTMAPKLNQIFHTLKQEIIPEVPYGQHCVKPVKCPFHEICLAESQFPEPSVLDIPGLKEKKWELIKRNIISLEDFPINELDEKQKVILKMIKNKSRFVDKTKVKEFIAKWKFPLIFLDFETINPAIPRFAMTSPFSQVPFQYSIHVLSQLDGIPEHREFLYETNDDPRKSLKDSLIRDCPTVGSIVCYYGVFEATRIQELEDLFPENQKELQQIRERIVDPLEIIREAIYDFQFKDSYSLKKVAPALLGKQASYADMQVSDGGKAQRAYARLISDKLAFSEKEILRKAMLEYCHKDTQVMVELVKWLYEIE